MADRSSKAAMATAGSAAEDATTPEHDERERNVGATGQAAAQPGSPARPKHKSLRSQMGPAELVKRYLIMIVGIFFISFGVALLTKSDTGTSAISVIPYTLSVEFPRLSYGTWVALFNMLIAILQIFLMRRETDWVDIAQQLVLAAFFGSFVDLAMWLLTGFHPTLYPVRLVTLAGSILVLAFGAYLTLISHVGVMAGDGFTRALSHVTGKEFGPCRVASDCSMAGTAVILNLAFFGTLVCVREGTLVSALCTGMVVGFYNHHLDAFQYALLPANRAIDAQAAEAAGQGTQAEQAVPSENFVVTIAREYGSGGREVGRAVADSLGISFYDSEIVARLAAEGISDTDAQLADQALSSNALQRFYDLYTSDQGPATSTRVSRVFAAEQRVIGQIASEGSCVIVGRLANWILRDHGAKLTVFVTADDDFKVAHAMERDGLTRAAAAEKIAKVDHERAEHCRYCTDTEWADPHGYDLVVNTSALGIEQASEVVTAAARTQMQRMAR